MKAPPKDVRAILFFGPDAGLIRERGRDMAYGFAAGRTDDVSELTGDAVRKDPAILSDSASALSLLGGEPVVRVRDAGDAITGAVESFLELGGGIHPLVIEGGDFGPRSKLRQLCEKRTDAAAIGCYPDDGRDLADVISSAVREAGCSIDQNAMGVLLGRLGTDRLAIRQELDKLILFHGGPGSGGNITAEEVEASVGDIRASSLDEVSNAVFGGDPKGLMTALDRTFSEGVSPIPVIRAVLRQLERLHFVKSLAAQGGGLDAAIKKLRPPLIFKQVDAFTQAARVWSEADLTRAFSHLLQAECDCKSGVGVDREICERALMQLAQAARRTRR